jgi:hypothetical protein
MTCLIIIIIFWTTYGHVHISCKYIFLIAPRRYNSLVNIETQNGGQLRLLLSAVQFAMYSIVTDCENTFSYSHATFLLKVVLSLDKVITVIMQLIQNILWCKRQLWVTEAGILKRMFQKPHLLTSFEHVEEGIKVLLIANTCFCIR